MATVLLAWEQGEGLDHLMRLKPLGEGLASQGQQVSAIARDLSRIERVFGNSVTTFFQAPVRSRAMGSEIAQPMTVAHILHNIGFSDAGELAALVRAWRRLYELTRPDMVIFDHCPLGLLAARGLPFKKVLVGTGFTCPPDDHPLPVLRPWVQADPAKLGADEDRILANINQALAGLRQPPLDHIMRLYAQVDSTLLTTFRELDHYPHRPETQYWGSWTKPDGLVPRWPEGKGKRIYAYLKRSAALPAMLAVLRRLEQPTIAYVDGLDQSMRQQFNTATLRLEDRPLNLQQAGQECDLAILNGGHGATVAMLLAGKPILQMPIYLEQAILARTVAELGMGLAIAPDQPAQLEENLTRLVGKIEQFTLAAEGFAVRYGDFDPAQQETRLLEHLAELLQPRQTGPIVAPPEARSAKADLVAPDQTPISVVIQTCDKYQSYWKGWFHTFTTHWDFDLPWPIYFCNEQIDLPFSHPRIRQLKTGPGEFSSRYIRILQTIRSPYLFYMQEDHWPHQAVPKGLFAELFDMARQHGMDCLRIHTTHRDYSVNGRGGLETTDLVCRRQHLLRYVPAARSAFMFSHQPAIWNKSFALAMQRENEAPLANEINATNRIIEQAPQAKIYVYHLNWYPLRGVSRDGQMTEYGRYVMQIIAENEAAGAASWRRKA